MAGIFFMIVLSNYLWYFVSWYLCYVSDVCHVNSFSLCRKLLLSYAGLISHPRWGFSNFSVAWQAFFLWLYCQITCGILCRSITAMSVLYVMLIHSPFVANYYWHVQVLFLILGGVSLIFQLHGRHFFYHCIVELLVLFCVVVFLLCQCCMSC